MRPKLLLGLIVVILILSSFLGSRAGLFTTRERGAEAEENGNAGTVAEPDPADHSKADPEPDVRTITIAAVGDITAHIAQMNQAYVGEGKYDFRASFQIIAPYLKTADLAVGSLETGQAGPDISFIGYRGFTGYPCFNAPVELSTALKQAGFDLISTANNHSMDRGLAGLKATLHNVRAADLMTFGTFLSEQERDTPVIKEVNGISVAFLSYTFSTNGIPLPEGHEYAVNFIENFHTIDPIRTDIKRARAAGADIVMVYMHWGEMYVTEPEPASLREIAREVARAGADLILGGHPHVVQPMEWLHTEHEDVSAHAAFVTYSLGNFISNQHYPANPTDLVQYGKLLWLEITKDMNTGHTSVSNVDYDITWVHRGWRHRVLPLSEVLAGDPADYNLDAAQQEQLRQGLFRIKQIVHKYGFPDYPDERD